MSEDAREIAHRIVQEVLEAHAATEAGHDAAESAPEVDLRETDGAGAPDAIADALDESPAREAARRIVAEVLAAHAEASRSTEHELPVAAEAEEPGPASASPVLQPLAGRPAVLPAAPEAPSTDMGEDVAEDAVAIARRIVASVLSEHTAGGPPPIPNAVRRPVVVDDPPPPRIIEDPAPDPVPVLILDDADEEPQLDAASSAEALDTIPADEGDAPDDEVMPVVAHGSHALRTGEPTEDPEPDEPVAGDDIAPALEPTEQLENLSPDATAVLAPDEGGEATARVPVATLERETEPEPEREAARRIEPTVAIPSAAAPRRTGRWLLASVLGAVAIAVLLPLAIEALRSLVAFS